MSVTRRIILSLIIQIDVDAVVVVIVTIITITRGTIATERNDTIEIKIETIEIRSESLVMIVMLI